MTRNGRNWCAKARTRLRRNSSPAGTDAPGLAAPAEALLAQDPAATLGDFQRQGFLRVYWNGEMQDIEEIGSPAPPPPDAALVIDRIIVRGENTASRLADSLQTALRINPDEVRAIITRPGEETSVQAFHTRYRNPETGFLLPQLTPRHFPSTLHWARALPARAPA